MFKKVARLKGKAKAAAHGKEQPTKEPLELKLNLEPHSLILSKGETRIWRSGKPFFLAAAVRPPPLRCDGGSSAGRRSCSLWRINLHDNCVLALAAGAHAHAHALGGARL